MDPKKRLTAKEALKHKWVQVKTTADTLYLDSSLTLPYLLDSLVSVPSCRQWAVPPCLLSFDWKLGAWAEVGEVT